MISGAQIGYALREYRTLNRMTQSDLAAYLGTSVEQVSRWELCKHYPRRKWVERMKERKVL